MPRPSRSAAPSRARRTLALTAAAAATLLPGIAAAQATPPLTTVRVASGVAQPTWIGTPRNDYNRLFIIEQGIQGVGRIRVLDLRTNTLLPEPYLTISGMHTGGENGLLSMAFHPDFADNGYFWIYGNFGTEVRLVRYRALGDPLTSNVADPDSAQIVLRVPDHHTVHNSGWMDFDAAGNLYLAVGDGGHLASAAAQDITDNLSGKILRIDLDGPDDIPGNEDDDGFPDDPDRHYTIPPDNPFVGVEGDDEIWAYGLRNPWRCDLDPATGDLYLADVGDGAWEEINFQPAHIPGAMPGDPGYTGGRNYGWPCYEGHAVRTPGLCADPDALTYPFLVYHHSQQVPPTNLAGCSVTGGLVYRGCAIPQLQGAYFFADFCNHNIFTLRFDGHTITEFTNRTAELNPGGGLNIVFISSFGRDAWGEIYIADLVGWEVFKIVPAVPHDINGDGIADGCRCPADWNGDGATNSNDISAFLAAWLDAVQNPPASADYNGDGVTNSNDISAFLASWLNALNGGC